MTTKMNMNIGSSYVKDPWQSTGASLIHTSTSARASECVDCEAKHQKACFGKILDIQGTSLRRVGDEKQCPWL